MTPIDYKALAAEVREMRLGHKVFGGTLEILETLLNGMAEQEPIAHMMPSDLERFAESETFAQAYSVAVSNPEERSVPLFTHPEPQPQPEKCGCRSCLTPAELLCTMRQ